MQSNIIYKKIPRQKSESLTIARKKILLLLQPNADHQGAKEAFCGFRWSGPYVVEKVLPNEDYTVGKVNSNKT